MSRIYTSEVSYRFYAGWHCSKCGKLHIRPAVIESQSSSYNSRNASNAAFADVILPMVMGSLKKERKVITYAAYFGGLSCSSCGHKECWMRWKNMDAFIKPVVMILFALIAAAVICLFCSQIATAILLAVAAAAVIGISLFFANLVTQHNGKVKRQIEAMPLSEDPIIENDLQIVADQMKKRYVQGSEQLSKELSVQVIMASRL